MDKRLILTFATGKEQYRTMAKGLAASLDLHWSTAPRGIVTDSDDPELGELFEHLIPKPEGFNHWFIKLCGLQATEADHILFIDGDCLAVRNVDSIFDDLRGSDFAVQGGYITSGHWYGDITVPMKKLGVSKVPKFSGGFLYYERTHRGQQLIERIMELAADYDSLGLSRNHGHIVDEVCIALAMEELGIGLVVPDSRDYSTTPWGARTPVHLDVVAGECSFVKGSNPPRTRQPAIYHSGMAATDPVYWRELKRVLDIRRSASGDRGTSTDAISNYTRMKHLKAILLSKLTK